MTEPTTTPGLDAAAENLASRDKSLLLGLYERMVLIREFEEQVKYLVLAGDMPGTIHQCQGQEATAVGEHPTFGWGRFSPNLRSANGGTSLRRSPRLCGLCIHDRALRVPEGELSTTRNWGPWAMDHGPWAMDRNQPKMRARQMTKPYQFPEPQSLPDSGFSGVHSP